MIVKMKKITLLVSESKRESFLARLRKLGIVHIKNLSIPSGDRFRSSEESLAHAKNALTVLERFLSYMPNHTKIKWSNKDLPEAVNRIVNLGRAEEDLKIELEDVQHNLNWFKPWGSFDTESLRGLEKKGIFVTLYKVSRGDLKKIKKIKNIHIISRDKINIYFSHLSYGKEEMLPFERIHLPDENYDELCKKEDSFKKKIGLTENELRDKTKGVDSLREYIKALEKENIFLNAMFGMKDEKRFSCLQGFCPGNKINEVIKYAKEEGFGYLAEEPDNPEEVPTLIRNPSWIKIIKPVFQFMNTIPGYNEFDISFWFLAFFSVFFAMLIGDAGYGILFLLITFFASKRFKKAKREPFRLLYVLSFATIAWGAATGTWFGSQEIAKLPFLNSLIVDKISSFVSGNDNFIIYICFVLGVVHLSIAHLIVAFKRINTLRALSDAGWVLILWGLFFAAGTLVIGKEFPGFAGYLLGAGSLLVILFSNAQKNIIKGIFASLADVPLKVISSFADIVSYLRLFAVGYASFIMAKSFNEMALSLGFNSIGAGLGAAFIMFFGHMLNIVLGLMAIIVHGVRLNMLEFSGQMGMEWSGKEYKPFSETSR